MAEIYTNHPDISYEEEYVEQSYSSEEESSTSFDPNKMTPQYHIQQAELALHNLKFVVKESGWKKVLQHKCGISVYSKPGITGDDNNIPVFMGEHIIEGFTSQAIFAVIGMRKLWDDWYEEGNLIENLNETTSLTYMIMQALAGSKTRDLSLVEKIECDQDGIIYFVTSSVETPKVPIVANRIRAHIHLNGWILEPLTYKPPRTKVIYVLQTRIKGWVPSILSKTYLARRPLVLHTIDQYLQKNGPPPMVFSTTPPESIRASRAPSDLSSMYQANTIQSNDNSDHMEVKYSRRKISFTDISEANLPPAKQKDVVPASPIPITEEILNDTLTYQDEHYSPNSPSSPRTPSSPTRTMSPVQPHSPIITENPSSPITSQKTKSIAKPIQHRHTAFVQNALETFKSHIPLDGWNFYSENKDVKIYMKEYAGKSTPIMRGDTVISGFTTYDILSVIKSLDTRKLWDERYDEGATYEMFSLHEHLTRTAMKGTFPISGRDFSVCGTLDHDDIGTLQFVTTSVVDPLIPESKKHVRGDLGFAGWLLKPHLDTNGITTSVDITYIVDIDIKLDTVPSSIRRTLSTQIPMIVAKINESMHKIGFSPYVIDSTTRIIKEEFSLKNDQYVLSLIAEGGGVTEFKISKLMYPKGVDVSTIPENCKVELLEDGADIIRVTLPPRVDLDTLIITVSKHSRDFQMTHNRGQKIPMASHSDSNFIPITKNPKPKIEKPAEITQRSIPTLQKQSKHPNHTTNVATSPDATIVAVETVDIKTDNHKITSPASRNIITPETFVEPSEVSLKSEPYQRMEKQTLLENKISAVTQALTPTEDAPKTEEPIVEKPENEVIENNVITLNNIHDAGDVVVITDSIRFNSHQVGLMFASMLLAYYAGKLSI